MRPKREVLVTLITKPDCHLCEEARPLAERAVEELRTEGVQVRFEERNMLDDPELERLYREDIPVVLIDGRRHSFWHVDSLRLRAAVLKRAGRRRFTR